MSHVYKKLTLILLILLLASHHTGLLVSNILNRQLLYNLVAFHEYNQKVTHTAITFIVTDFAGYVNDPDNQTCDDTGSILPVSSWLILGIPKSQHAIYLFCF